jgi:hypothetical protein
MGGGNPGPSVKLVSLQGSVGRSGRNLKGDVFAVQDALNEIDLIDGGPMPLLATDSICGPKTVGAIEKFQRVQFPGKFPDGRMDPGQRTVTRLNALLSEGSVAGVVASSNSSFPGDGNARFGIRQASSFAGERTTNEQLALAERLAEDAEKRILAAINRLNRATAALAKKTRTPAERELVREIDWHFKVSAEANPASHLGKISFVFASMLTAVREQNLGIRSIFKAGTHPDPDAIAAAELGGFHSLKQDERFIIITPQFRTQSSGVIVHELAHFCGGSRSSGKDVVHRASPKPPPNGTRKEDGSTDYRNMTPFQARTNVYSYQIYCFPELAEFKVPA